MSEEATTPFNTCTLLTVAGLGLCLLVGCSSADTSGSSGSPSPRPLVEREGIPLAPGTYQIGYHRDGDEDVPDAFVTVPSGYVESSTWFVVSEEVAAYRACTDAVGYGRFGFGLAAQVRVLSHRESPAAGELLSGSAPH